MSSVFSPQFSLVFGSALKSGAKVQFISAQYLKDKTIIQVNSDEKVLNIAIREFQEIEMRTILGKTEYLRLSEALYDTISNGADLSDSDRELMDYITPVMRYGSLMYSIPALHRKLGNKGVGIDLDDKLQTGSTDEGRADFAFKMDGYKRLLIDYLKEKKPVMGCQSEFDTTFNFLGVSMPDHETNIERRYNEGYYYRGY